MRSSNLSQIRTSIDGRFWTYNLSSTSCSPSAKRSSERPETLFFFSFVWCGVDFKYVFKFCWKVLFGASSQVKKTQKQLQREGLSEYDQV